MAERPIFVPAPGSRELVREVLISLEWHSGFAVTQKEKNIKALHASAAEAGFSPLLEVSTKSDRLHGRHLSAFHMTLQSARIGKLSIESAFQGSKVFEKGGPFTDLYFSDGRQAKRDPRLAESGKLLGFHFEDFFWPLEPKTAFYDWLYVSFLNNWRDWATKLTVYAGFTDIEFNPSRSLNCQARSCALFISLLQADLLDEAMTSASAFIEVLRRFDYPRSSNPHTQLHAF